MLVLITGGAGSGKSAMAERICGRFNGKTAYIATMRPHGDEAAARIDKHRRQRAGLGFVTLECYNNLETLIPPGDCCCALLDCMGNLVANEMFDLNIPAEILPKKILDGAGALSSRLELFVVVSNEVFSGSQRFADETAAYIECLGGVNRALAKQADVVIESVAGLAIFYKNNGDVKL